MTIIFIFAGVSICLASQPLNQNNTIGEIMNTRRIIPGVGHMLTIAHYQYPYSRRALAMKTTSALLQRNPNIADKCEI